MAQDRDDLVDEPYFEGLERNHGFDTGLLREPLTDLPVRTAIVMSSDSTVTDAIRAMQREHRGCVIITDDGTQQSKLTGIFTERDVLFRIASLAMPSSMFRFRTPCSWSPTFTW